MLGAQTHTDTHTPQTCFAAAAAAAFMVHVRTPQNCVYMALGDRSQGSESGQSPDSF